MAYHPLPRPKPLPRIYGIRAIRDAQSVFGPGFAWMRHKGNIVIFSDYDEARQYAKRLMDQIRSPHLHYEVAEFE